MMLLIVCYIIFVKLWVAYVMNRRLFHSPRAQTYWAGICLLLGLCPGGGGGGTHYVRVMGRLRGIDPPFFKALEKNLDFRPPFFKVPEKNIDFRPPFFRILRKKVNFRPLFSPRHRL